MESGCGSCLLGEHDHHDPAASSPYNHDHVTADPYDYDDVTAGSVHDYDYRTAEHHDDHCHLEHYKHDDINVHFILDDHQHDERSLLHKFDIHFDHFASGNMVRGRRCT